MSPAFGALPAAPALLIIRVGILPATAIDAQLAVVHWPFGGTWHVCRRCTVACEAVWSCAERCWPLLKQQRLHILPAVF